MDTKIKISGMVYGSAIGDALGVGAEGMTKPEMRKQYPRGLRSYEECVAFAELKRGEWTDDTNQMLCIMDTLLECRSMDVQVLAQKLLYWLKTDGRGLGSTTEAVLTADGFLDNPHRIAEQVWRNTGCKNAANGAVMRTAIIGAYQPDDLASVIFNAERACKVTHFDPRCVASCVAVSVAVATLLTTNDVGAAIDAASKAATKYDPIYDEFFVRGIDASLVSYELDSAKSMGYTAKTTMAAFHVLKHAPSFIDGLYSVIDEAGDADTNAAVAGALLGARFGVAAIPEHLIIGLINREALHERLRRWFGGEQICP